MKHTYTVILAILLVVAMAVPAFATDAENDAYFVEEMRKLITDFDEVYASYPYYVIFQNGTGTEVVFSKAPLKVANNGYITLYSTVADNRRAASHNGDEASTYPIDLRKGYATVTIYVEVMYYANHIVTFGNGESYFPVMCDGTICPATDPNHDNLCDDCGLPLTMGLRSTLLQFAQTKAESWANTWPYYAVVSDGVNEDRYMVYMSNNPQVADASTGKIVTSPNGLNRFEVTTNRDGTFEASGNYGETSWSGELVYANHEIENFRMPPLAVIIQGVTGEAMKAEIPNLTRTMTTILLCGVGCLALLILLPVFLKALRTFLR